MHPNVVAQLTRSEALKAIQYYQQIVHNKTAVDFPLSCLSNPSLELLFNLSLTAEQSFLPHIQSDHRQQFEHDVQMGKICAIDVLQTLEIDERREFLRPFVSVAPHVLERGHDRRWTSDFEASTKSVLLFAFRLGRPRLPALP